MIASRKTYLRSLLRLYGRLMARPLMYKVNRIVFMLGIRGLGILNWESPALRGEEAFLNRLFAGHSAMNPVVLDVGANVGDYTALILLSAPNASILAFEPHPVSFEVLTNRFSNSNVSCYPAAAGSRSGKVQLFDHPDDPGSSHASLLRPVFELFHAIEPTSREVPMIRLADLLASQGINHIFLIKIDVEGMELDVLRGLMPFLDQPDTSVENIQLEFNEMNVVSRTFLADILELLPGYRVYRILPRGRLVDLTDERPIYRELFGYQNLIFKRASS